MIFKQVFSLINIKDCAKSLLISVAITTYKLPFSIKQLIKNNLRNIRLQTLNKGKNKSEGNQQSIMLKSFKKTDRNAKDVRQRVQNKPNKFKGYIQ